MMKRILVNLTGSMLLAISANAIATSLFSDETYRPMTGDHRAFSVGQSLTVLIYEQASAATTASTETGRSSTIGGEVRGNDNRYEGNLSVNNDFEGGGSINRTGKLVASVTVTINDKLANGELLIGGEQVIEFNDENQHIKLSGRVRPQDISANNTVLSTRVADAKITYVGDGLLGKRQKPGILTRFFHWLF